MNAYQQDAIRSTLTTKFWELFNKENFCDLPKFRNQLFDLVKEKYLSDLDQSENHDFVMNEIDNLFQLHINKHVIIDRNRFANAGFQFIDVNDEWNTLEFFKPGVNDDYRILLITPNRSNTICNFDQQNNEFSITTDITLKIDVYHKLEGNKYKPEQLFKLKMNLSDEHKLINQLVHKMTGQPNE